MLSSLLRPDSETTMSSKAKYTPSYTIEKNLDASDWFEEVTGLEEKEWMDRRGEFIELGAPVDGDSSLGHHLLIRHSGGERLWDAGAFRVWSLSELEAAAESKMHEADDTQTAECEFEIHIRKSIDIRPVEVSSLQADSCKAENQKLGGTMFQVASNFNCCENASYRRAVDSGNFVTNLMADSTQGPAAASGAGVAAITRTHAAFFSPDTAPLEWGQTSSRQVELLGDPALAPHFPVTNGKLLALDAPPPPGYADPWSDPPPAPAAPPPPPPPHGAVRAGLHCGARAHFVRVPGGCAAVAEAPAVDQCFVAALCVGAPGAAALPQSARRGRMRFLLEAAYRCTYAAAAMRGSGRLVLTCVGGGCFGNPAAEVAAALAAAHAEWAPRARGRLRRVVLPLFCREVNAAAPYVAALEAVGVRPVVVEWA